MTASKPAEKVTVLRWLSIMALGCLFVTDYGLDIWAKDVPNYAYGLLLALAVGVDAKNFRDVLINFMNKQAEK